MLTIQQSSSASSAQAYFAQHLQPGDYYGQEGARPGLWFGRGAERLGLSGRVGAADFAALADNRHPDTGQRLTVRDTANRRAGYDFTFSPPKSVSALWARTGDDRIAQAVFQSALDTLTQDIEPEMKTRLRRNGAQADVVTGNLVGSLFLHETSRPLQEDGRPDPQLHVHAFCFNSTWAEHERRWQAGQFAALKADGSYFDSAFLARLGARLRQLGYDLERNAKGSYEIAGVPVAVIEKFSRRTFQEIEPEAKARGITDPRQKGQLGAKTRQKKGKEPLALSELRQYWNGRLSGDEAAALDAVQEGARPGGDGGTASPLSAAATLAHAVGHFFGPDGRDSAVAEKAVLEEALRYGTGTVLPADVKQALPGSALIRAEIGGRTICTTQEVLAEEQALVSFARAGRQAVASLAAGRPWVADPRLSREQAAAVRQLLDTPDRVQMLLGRSGTGKTTTLKALEAALRERGQQLLAFAPTSRASRGVLREKGFTEATTVADLLDKPALQAQVRGNVILIDEAGLAGTRALRQVFELAGRQDARVLLVGDPQQHRGVPRGQVLHILQDQAALVPARLTVIRRQAEPRYRQAVEALSQGHVEEGFDRLDRLGFLREIPEADERYRALARDYADTLASGQSALLVAPTHAEGELVSAAVRAELRARGQLGAEDRSLVRYQSRGLTTQQRQDAVQYQPGDTVQWNQNAPGFRRGEKLTVCGRRDGRVQVQDAAGQTRELPLALAERFELYRTGSLDLAAGDRVRITRNGATAGSAPHRLNNGDMLTVAGFTPSGDLIDQRGWVIPANYGHLAPGILTSHASQGMEADVVLVAQSGLSRGASSAEQFYVSAGRGEKAVHWYTDDKETLRLAVSRSDQARSAAEVWQASEEQRRHQHQVWWRRQQQRRRWAAARAGRERLAEREGRPASPEQRPAEGMSHV